MKLSDAPWSGALLDVIGRLARAATQDFTPEDVLQQLCDAAAEALSVDGAGVMGLNLGRTRFVRASRPGLEPIERLQEALQSGPCREAIDSATPIAAGTQDEIGRRWPDFAAVATELAGEHPPAGLVLRSPFVDLAAVGREHYPFLPVRALLREKGTLFHELGLGDPGLSDDQLLDAMMAHPILINRPLVETEKGVRLCRPQETVREIL